MIGGHPDPGDDNIDVHPSARVDKPGGNWLEIRRRVWIANRKAARRVDQDFSRDHGLDQSDRILVSRWTSLTVARGGPDIACGIDDCHRRSLCPAPGRGVAVDSLRSSGPVFELFCGGGPVLLESAGTESTSSNAERAAIFDGATSGDGDFRCAGHPCREEIPGGTSRNRLIGTISIFMAQHVATCRPGLRYRTAEDAIEIIRRLFASPELSNIPW